MRDRRGHDVLFLKVPHDRQVVSVRVGVGGWVGGFNGGSWSEHKLYIYMEKKAKKKNERRKRAGYKRVLHVII